MARHQTPQQREAIMDKWIMKHFDKLYVDGIWMSRICYLKPKELSRRMFEQLLSKYCFTCGYIATFKPKYRKIYYDRWRRDQRIQNELDNSPYKYKFIER